MQHNITHKSILHYWINFHDIGHTLCKSHNNKGDRIMTNGRITTYEEIVDIVSFCIANANDYNLTANKYNISIFGK